MNYFTFQLHFSPPGLGLIACFLIKETFWQMWRQFYTEWLVELDYL